MKREKLQIEWEVITKPKKLAKQDAQLLKLAKASLQQAYAPYSNFKVGAAVLLENGKMLGGSNQENAAYPMCLCAERVALAAAVSTYPDKCIQKMAITVKAPNQIIGEPVMPCGSCRQALCEQEYRQKTPIQLVLRGEAGAIYIFESAKTILPFSFNASFL